MLFCLSWWACTSNAHSSAELLPALACLCMTGHQACSRHPCWLSRAELQESAPSCVLGVLSFLAPCRPEGLPFVAEGRTWSPGMISVTRPVYASTTVTAVNLDSSRAKDANPQPCYPDICFAVDNFDNTFEDLVSCWHTGSDIFSGSRQYSCACSAGGHCCPVRPAAGASISDACASQLFVRHAGL